MSFDLAQALSDATPGAVVNVPAGAYAANLLIDKPVSLIAMGKVVLDGQKHGSVLRVRTDGVVKLAGLMVVGGRTGLAGGGVAVEAGELEMLSCTLRFNEAPAWGGGGLCVRGSGTARVTQCRFEGNLGRQGAGVLVDEGGRLSMKHCLLAQNAAFEGGGLCAKEGAVVELLGCTLADNKVLGDAPRGGAVALGGTMTRAPRVTLSHCIVAERTRGASIIANVDTYPGTLSLTRNLLPEWCTALGGDNLFAEPHFVGEGTEPYFLRRESPAVGAAAPGVYDAAARDVLGRPRGQPGDLGAFAYTG
ncbi:MAG: right-handed parallel beta-helix repeat-containing protein [Myxococcota bacterium]